MKKIVFLIGVIFLFASEINIYGAGIPEGEKKVKSKKEQKNSRDLPVVSGNTVITPNPTGKAVSYPARGILFAITPAFTQIHNKDISGNDQWDKKSNFGFNVEVSYFAKLGRIVSIGAGLGYSSYNSEVSADSAFQEYPLIRDDDGHNVIYHVKTNQLSEKVGVSYFDVPIYLEFGNPNVDKIGFYGRLGLKVSFPISSKLTGEGTYTSWGYYPDCPVELWNIPELGYYSNEPIYNDMAVADLAPVNLTLLLSAGLTVPISNYLIFKLGVNMNYGLSEISDVKAEDDAGMKLNGNYSKLLNNPSKTNVRSYGMEIGLIYNLRLY